MLKIRLSEKIYNFYIVLLKQFTSCSKQVSIIKLLPLQLLFQ